MKKLTAGVAIVFLGKVAPPTVPPCSKIWHCCTWLRKSRTTWHYLNFSWPHCAKLLQLVCSFLQLSKYGKNSFGANVYTLKLLENWRWLKLLLAIKQGERPFFTRKTCDNCSAISTSTHLSKTYIHDNNFCRTSRNDPVNGHTV